MTHPLAKMLDTIKQKEASIAKPKTKRIDAPAGDGPTPQRLARDGFEVIAAPKLGDEDWRTRNATARKVACRVTRMHRDGWFDSEGFRAMLAYQALIETAGYDRSRSCIDFAPKGNGYGLPPAVVSARHRLASLDSVLGGCVGNGGLALVRAVLGPCGMETVSDTVEMMQPDMGRNARMAYARHVFAVAAAKLSDCSR